MKKIMVLLICMSLFLVKITEVRADEQIKNNEKEYNIKIKVYDTDNNRLSLEEATFHIEAGDVTLNIDGKEGTKHGYGFYGSLDGEIGYENFRISSKVDEDIILTMSGDYGNYQFFIEEKIPLEDLKKNETLNLDYRLSELKEITLNSKMKEKSESLKYYICRIDISKAAHSDELAGGWAELTDIKDKKIYANRGVYKIFFSSRYKTVHKLFNERVVFLLGDTDIQVDADKKEYDYVSVEIPDIYDEFGYYGLMCSIKKFTTFEIWNDRKDSNKVEFYIDKDIKLVHKRMYLSNKMNHIYKKSVGFDLEGKMKLGDKYHYSNIYVSKHRDGKFGTNVSAADNRKNLISFIDIERVDDVNIEIYSKDTGELVFEDGFSSYWDYLELDIDMSEDYTVKIFSKTDKNVNASTYFNLTFTSQGMPVYELKKIVYDK